MLLQSAKGVARNVIRQPCVILNTYPNLNIDIFVKRGRGQISPMPPFHRGYFVRCIFIIIICKRILNHL